MKKIQINFISDHRWKWVWGLALLSIGCLAGAYAWQWHGASRLARETEDLISVARQNLALLGAPKEAPLNPKRASAEQAAKLLQQDMNKVFATIENLKEPGTRLRNLSLDGASGILRLEFEIDSVVRASTLTAALNEGYGTRPWQLESVSSAASSNFTGFATSHPMRALWFVDISKL